MACKKKGKRKKRVRRLPSAPLVRHSITAKNRREMEDGYIRNTDGVVIGRSLSHLDFGPPRSNGHW